MLEIFFAGTSSIWAVSDVKVFFCRHLECFGCVRCWDGFFCRHLECWGCVRCWGGLFLQALGVFGLCQMLRCFLLLFFAGTWSVWAVSDVEVSFVVVFCRHLECLGCVRSTPLLTTCVHTCPVTSLTCCSGALFCWLGPLPLVLLPSQPPWAVSLSSNCWLWVMTWTRGLWRANDPTLEYVWALWIGKAKAELRMSCSGVLAYFVRCC